MAAASAAEALRADQAALQANVSRLEGELAAVSAELAAAAQKAAEPPAELLARVDQLQAQLEERDAQVSKMCCLASGLAPGLWCLLYGSLYQSDGAALTALKDEINLSVFLDTGVFPAVMSSRIPAALWAVAEDTLCAVRWGGSLEKTSSLFIRAKQHLCLLPL